MRYMLPILSGCYLRRTNLSLVLVDAAAHVTEAAAALLEVIADLVNLLHRLLLDVARVLAAAVVAVAAASGEVVVADLIKLFALSVVARFANALLLCLGRRDAVASLVKPRVIVPVEEPSLSVHCHSGSRERQRRW